MFAIQSRTILTDLIIQDWTGNHSPIICTNFTPAVKFYLQSNQQNNNEIQSS